MNSGDPDPHGSSAADSREKWIAIDRLCDAYEASLQEGGVERAPFLAGVPKDWRQQLTHELDAIDAAYRDADETREQTIKVPAEDSASRRLPTKGRLAELASLDSDKVWLGRFEIRKRLGTGATGSVWSARDARLARWVALKVPHASRVTSETSAARFQTEARAAAAITHPNVVQVHEVLIEDGLPILIQQWIDGPSLAKYLKENGPMDFDQAADWMIQISDAVACAHDQGIVHRDLKPANVMLNKNRPMVLDFGLASYPQFSSGLTTEGTVLGTPAYMSPEQANGAENANQPPTDIYALGTILYEMLVGTPPFVGKAREVLQANKTAIPTPPRSRRAAIPRDLETIALRCLAKSPSARYRSAADLRDDLERFRRRKPIRARKVSFTENVLSWCRLHPAYALLLTGIPLVVLLLMGMVFSQLRHNQLSHRTNFLVRQNRENANQRTELLELLHQRHMVDLSQASRELSEGDRTRGLQLLRNIPIAARNWEWRLLDLISHSPSRTLNANVAGINTEASVTSLAVSTKHRRVFSASRDGTILVWSMPGDRALFNKDRDKQVGLAAPSVLYKDEVAVHAMSVSPDDKWLTWVDRNAKVTIWDLNENERAQQIVLPRCKAGHALTFSPNSLQLAVGGGSNATFDRPADERSWLFTLKVNDSGEFSIANERRWNNRLAITSLKFISDDKLISTRGQSQASLGSVGDVERWKCTSESLVLLDLLWRGLSMRGLDYDPGSNRLAWCDDGGMAYIKNADAPAGDPPKQFQASRRGALQVRFAPGRQELVVTASDGGVSLWAIPTATTPSDGVISSSDVSTFDSEKTDSESETADASHAATLPDSIPPESDTAVADASLSKVANPLLADSASPIDQPTIRHIRDYHGHENTVRDAVFLTPCVNLLRNLKPRDSYLANCSPYLITCGEDGRVIRWSNEGHAEIGTLNVNDRSLVDATWVSKQQLAVVTGAGKRQKPLHFRGFSIKNHGLSVDTRRVRLSKSIAKTSPIVGSGDQTTAPPRFAVCTSKTIYVFETGVRDVDAERTLVNIRGHVFTAVCPISSRYLLAASQQPLVTAKPSQPQTKDDTPPRTARQTALLLYDLQTDLPPQTLLIDTVGSVSRLDVSPDGRRVFGCCNDGKMFFVPIETDGVSFGDWSDTPIHSWRAHHRAIRDFVWVSHRQQLATVSDDGTCAIWKPQVGRLSDLQSSTNLSYVSDVQSDNAPLVLGQRLHISSGAVTRVTATSNGDRIATVGEDRVIRVWDAESGLELISLEPRKENVASIEFSPDDRFLMVAEVNSRIDVIQLID